jgi:pimeloyl-ACP methyl ester carboxylesterase
MSAVTDPTVLLLHEQLADARIWNGFTDLLSSHARVVTPTGPAPDHLLPAPSQWAAHIGAQARDLLAGGPPVALCVSAGTAAGAAMALLEGGLAERALLINPNTIPAPGQAPEVPSPADLSEAERARYLAEGITPGPQPEPTGEWADQVREGVLREEAFAYVEEMTADDRASLGPAQRRLIERVQRENLARVLPVSLAEMREVDWAREPRWADAAVRHPDRCTLALSQLRAVFDQLRAWLRTHSPALPLVELPQVTDCPWLEDPERIDRLVRDLLARRPGPA